MTLGEDLWNLGEENAEIKTKKIENLKIIFEDSHSTDLNHQNPREECNSV